MHDNEFFPGLSRRRFLDVGGKLVLLGLLPVPALADPVPPAAVTSRLALLNTHTGERLSCAYRENGSLIPDAMAAIDHFLRDVRTGEVRPIDPRVLDVIEEMSRTAAAGMPVHIVSGYRSAATNAMLRQHRDGVARRSYHIKGKAVDFRIPGVSTAALHALALRLRAGGVGYYPSSDFVHVDTGPVRSW